MVIEGMLALTGQHFIMDYNEREGTLPGFVEGFQNVARDEHRHVAFGSASCARRRSEDERYSDAIQRTLEEALPVADGCSTRPGPTRTTGSCSASAATRPTRSPRTCLTRRLKVIGLV